MRSLACLMALAVTAPALAVTAPDAPYITTGAGFKSLRLDWEPAARAAYYQVYFRPRAGAAFQKLGPDLPASQRSAEFRISLHLFDWQGARYRVSACNSAGCAAGPAASVSAHRLNAVGYFKPPRPELGSMLGEDLDMSPDGANFIASAPQSHFDYLTDAGSAFVFRRGAGNQWVQRARLRPALSTAGGGLDMRVAISADGNTAAMGLPNLAGGQVYVFKYANGSWTRTRITPVAGGGFGGWIGLNDAGNALAVKEPNGFAIYRLNGGSWQRSTVVSNAPGRTEVCVRGLLTRDGSTVAENCYEGGTQLNPVATYLRVHSGPAFSSRTEFDLGYVAPANSSRDRTLRYGVGASRNGDVIAAQNLTGVAGVKVFRRTAGVYALETRLAPGAWQSTYSTYFGTGIAISGDGRTLAIGDVFGMGEGRGVQKPPLVSSDMGDPGSVYVYQRNSSAWLLRSVVKPNHQMGWEGALAETFGEDVALCATGATLVVGQPRESSVSVGIGGAWGGSQMNTYSGAVWMY
jgi:hypothetical protein